MSERDVMAVSLNLSSFDELLADPTKAALLSPQDAQACLIAVATIYPILLQRALTRHHNGQDEDLLLTIPQVAKRLNVSEYRAYELARQGVLKSVRLGKSVRVKPSNVDEYIARQGA